MKAALTLKRVSLENNIGPKSEQFTVRARLQQGSTLFKIFHFRFKPFALLLTQRVFNFLYFCENILICKSFDVSLSLLFFFYISSPLRMLPLLLPFLVYEVEQLP